MRVLLVLALICFAMPSHAQLVANQVRKTLLQWRNDDNCARQAIKLFPDYTKESNAQREKWRIKCVRGGFSDDPAPDVTLPGEVGADEKR